jgi:hypothetical protein
VEIRAQGNESARAALPMQAVYRKDTPPGPVGRAFIAALRQ